MAAKVTLKLSLDNSDAKKVLKDTFRGVEKGYTIKLSLDNDEFRSQFSEAQNLINDLENGSVSLTFDTSDIDNAIKKVKQQMNMDDPVLFKKLTDNVKELKSPLETSKLLKDILGVDNFSSDVDEAKKQMDIVMEYIHKTINEINNTKPLELISSDPNDLTAFNTQIAMLDKIMQLRYRLEKQSDKIIGKDYFSSIWDVDVTSIKDMMQNLESNSVGLYKQYLNETLNKMLSIKKEQIAMIYSSLSNERITGISSDDAYYDALIKSEQKALDKYIKEREELLEKSKKFKGIKDSVTEESLFKAYEEYSFADEDDIKKAEEFYTQFAAYVMKMKESGKELPNDKNFKSMQELFDYMSKSNADYVKSNIDELNNLESNMRRIAELENLIGSSRERITGYAADSVRGPENLIDVDIDAGYLKSRIEATIQSAKASPQIEIDESKITISIENAINSITFPDFSNKLLQDIKNEVITVDVQPNIIWDQSTTSTAPTSPGNKVLENEFEKLLGEDFSTKNKSEATKQLKEAYEKFNPFVEANNSYEDVSEEGTKAGYIYCKAFEEAVKKGISEKSLDRYSVDRNEYGDSHFYNRYSNSTNEEFDEILTTYTLRAQAFSDIINEVRTNFGNIDLSFGLTDSSKIIDDILRYVDAAERLERIKFDLASDEPYIGYTQENLESQLNWVNFYKNQIMSNASIAPKIEMPEIEMDEHEIEEEVNKTSISVPVDIVVNGELLTQSIESAISIVDTTTLTSKLNNVPITFDIGNIETIKEKIVDALKNVPVGIQTDELTTKVKTAIEEAKPTVDIIINPITENLKTDIESAIPPVDVTVNDDSVKKGIAKAVTEAGTQIIDITPKDISKDNKKKVAVQVNKGVLQTSIKEAIEAKEPYKAKIHEKELGKSIKEAVDSAGVIPVQIKAGELSDADIPKIPITGNAGKLIQSIIDDMGGKYVPVDAKATVIDVDAPKDKLPTVEINAKAIVIDVDAPKDTLPVVDIDAKATIVDVNIPEEVSPNINIDANKEYLQNSVQTGISSGQPYKANVDATGLDSSITNVINNTNIPNIHIPSNKIIIDGDIPKIDVAVKEGSLVNSAKEELNGKSIPVDVKATVVDIELPTGDLPKAHVEADPNKLKESIDKGIANGQPYIAKVQTEDISDENVRIIPVTVSVNPEQISGDINKSINTIEPVPVKVTTNIDKEITDALGKTYKVHLNADLTKKQAGNANDIKSALEALNPLLDDKRDKLEKLINVWDSMVAKETAAITTLNSALAPLLDNLEKIGKIDFAVLSEYIKQTKGTGKPPLNDDEGKTSKEKKPKAPKPKNDEFTEEDRRKAETKASYDREMELIRKLYAEKTKQETTFSQYKRNLAKAEEEAIQAQIDKLRKERTETDDKRDFDVENLEKNLKSDYERTTSSVKTANADPKHAILNAYDELIELKNVMSHLNDAAISLDSESDEFKEMKTRLENTKKSIEEIEKAISKIISNNNIDPHTDNDIIKKMEKYFGKKKAATANTGTSKSNDSKSTFYSDGRTTKSLTQSIKDVYKYWNELQTVELFDVSKLKEAETLLEKIKILYEAIENDPNYINRMTHEEQNPIRAEVNKFESLIKEAGSNYNRKYIGKYTNVQDIRHLNKNPEAILEAQRDYITNTLIGNHKQGNIRQTARGFNVSFLNEQTGMIEKYEIAVDSTREAITQWKAGEDEYVSTGKKMANNLKDKVLQISQYVGVIDMAYKALDMLKQGVQVVRDMDTAMTELKKVTDETARVYENFPSVASNIAKEVGSTSTEIVNATADWARMGYSIKEAQELAKTSAMYVNVGDGIDMETANASLISTLQGFQLKAEDAQGIVDKFNEVANNFAIDSAGIGDALQRSAASFYAANTDLSSAIALITATNSVVQNPEKVGNMWKTVSARLRGAASELEEMGEDTEGVITSTSKLRNIILSMTDFDIMVNDTTFKDIKDIIIGIGKEWDKLSDVNQAALLEKLAGKTQANALAAALENYELIEEAYETAENSAGSATKENEKYMDSINGHIIKLQESFNQLWLNAIPTEALKGIIDLGTNILNLTNDVGLLQIALAGVVAMLGKKYDLGKTNVYAL